MLYISIVFYIFIIIITILFIVRLTFAFNCLNYWKDIFFDEKVFEKEKEKYKKTGEIFTNPDNLDFYYKNYNKHTCTLIEITFQLTKWKYIDFIKNKEDFIEKLL